MKKYTLLFTILFTLSIPSFASAETGDQCETASDCDTGEGCISNVCAELGNVTITLTWTGATDLDLHVVTPRGEEISPDITDTIEADGGRLVLDDCYSNQCEGDPRPASNPHAEHVVWSRNVPVVPGRYRVWAENFDGAAATNYEVTFKHPDGKTEVAQGTVNGTRGARSQTHSFTVERMDCDEDSDGDGLCDAWEMQGMDLNGDGVIDLDLPRMGADPFYKDIFLEIDWIVGDAPVPMRELVRIFKNAPVQNPNGKEGIAVHVELSDEINAIANRPIGVDHPINFGMVKTVKFNNGVCRTGAWFGSARDRASSNCEAIMDARMKVFHYLLNGDTNDTNEAAGQAERPGNDIIINTRRGGEPRPRWEVVATAHELGHNLGLAHGGQDETNCKPNYLSMMNYAYLGVYLGAETPNFSMQKLPFLNENALFEERGIQGPRFWNPVMRGVGRDDQNMIRSGSGNADQDWNNDGSISANAVSFDVTASPKCPDHGLDVLHSYEDWSNLQFNFRNSDGYQRDLSVIQQGLDSEIFPNEIDVDILMSSINSDDPDNDGVGTFDDLCPEVSDPNQEDRDGDSVGDACDACPDQSAFGSFDGCPFEVDTITDTSKNPTEDANADPVDSVDPVSDPFDEEALGGKPDSLADSRPDRLDTQAGGCATTSPTSPLPLLVIFMAFSIRRRTRD